jgi:hypothetical protein
MVLSSLSVTVGIAAADVMSPSFLKWNAGEDYIAATGSS